MSIIGFCLICYLPEKLTSTILNLILFLLGKKTAKQYCNYSSYYMKECKEAV